MENSDIMYFCKIGNILCLSKIIFETRFPKGCSTFSNELNNMYKIPLGRTKIFKSNLLSFG